MFLKRNSIVIVLSIFLVLKVHSTKPSPVLSDSFISAMLNKVMAMKMFYEMKMKPIDQGVEHLNSVGAGDIQRQQEWPTKFGWNGYQQHKVRLEKLVGGEIEKARARSSATTRKMFFKMRF